MFKRLTLSVLLSTLVAPGLSAQGGDVIGSRSTRVTALTGGLAHSSALVVGPAGGTDTRLSPGPTFGLEVQFPTFSLASLYAGAAGSFSTMEHGSNLGAAAGPGSSGVTIILGTAGLAFEASDWFDNLRPTLRLGGGFKAYRFTTSAGSSSASPTADIGVGFRGGTGAIEIAGELRFLPSSFDQAKLPLRSLVPQDQQQNDLLFTVGVTVRP